MLCHAPFRNASRARLASAAPGLRFIRLVMERTWPTMAALSSLHPLDRHHFPVPVSGLGSGGLRRAIHDLRGPLNTLAILHEVLRVSPPRSGSEAANVLAPATRALGKLSTMLDRLRSLAECVPDRLEAVPLAECLAEAVRRMPSDARVAVASLPPDAPAAIALSCRERLVATLETALNCAAGALPHGGRMELQVSMSPDSCRIEMVCTGEDVAREWGPSRGKLDSDDPAVLDWFRLACQVEGLAGRLQADVPPLQPRLAIDLPRPR